MNTSATIALLVLAATPVIAQQPKPAPAPAISVIGYVRDSGCVHRFHEVVKPLPNGCVEACARGGSPLLILTKSEEVYHPISAAMPDVDVRPSLLPFLGKLVRITGHIYDRGGSRAIALEAIEEVVDGVKE